MLGNGNELKRCAQHAGSSQVPPDLGFVTTRFLKTLESVELNKRVVRTPTIRAGLALRCCIARLSSCTSRVLDAEPVVFPFGCFQALTQTGKSVSTTSTALTMPRPAQHIYRSCASIAIQSSSITLRLSLQVRALSMPFAAKFSR